MKSDVETSWIAAVWEPRLEELGTRVRDALRGSLARQDLEFTSAVERDDAGDTIFAIDVDAETILMELAERWGQEGPFVLVAEGLDPTTGLGFGRGEPRARLSVGPIDGTR